MGFYQFELCVLPQFDLILFFLWAILSAFRPLSLSEQVKNKDPLKIATKVTPPFIHLSLSVSPSSLLLTPSSPSTKRQKGSVQSISLSLCCTKGDVLSPCFTCKRVQLSTFKSLTANHSIYSCHGNCHRVTMGLFLCLKFWEYVGTCWAQKKVPKQRILCREIITRSIKIANYNVQNYRKLIILSLIQPPECG